MIFAIVNVLPLPVTPRSVWNRLPSIRPFVNFSIACGWSPEGMYSLTNLNLFIYLRTYGTDLIAGNFQPLFPNLICHSRENGNPVYLRVWIPHQSCPQLDWGYGMTTLCKLFNPFKINNLKRNFLVYYIISKDTSNDLTECVRLPMEMMSTPVLAILRTFLSVMPPDASSNGFVREG